MSDAAKAKKAPKAPKKVRARTNVAPLYQTTDHAGVYNFYTFLSVAHALVGITAWALLCAKDTEAYLMYGTARFFVRGVERRTDGAPLGLLGFIFMFFGYLGAVTQTMIGKGPGSALMRRFLGDGPKDRALWIFGLLSVGDAGLFLSLSLVMAQQELYEIVCGALAVMGATLFHGAIANSVEGAKGSVNLPWNMALLASAAGCVPYVLGIITVAAHGTLYVSDGTRGGALYQAAFWIGATGKIALEVIKAYAFVWAPNLFPVQDDYKAFGGDSANENSTRFAGNWKKFKFTMTLINWTGFLSMLVLFFVMHSDWEVYAPIYWIRGPHVGQPSAFPAAALVVAAWGVHGVAALYAWWVLVKGGDGADRELHCITKYGTDHWHAVAYSISSGLLVMTAGLVVGVAGLMELVELVTFAVTGTLILHMGREHWAKVLGSLLSLGPWWMILAKQLYLKDDGEDGSLALIVSLLAVAHMYVVVDMSLRICSAANTFKRGAAQHLLALVMLTAASMTVTQLVTHDVAAAAAV